MICPSQKSFELNTRAVSLIQQNRNVEALASLRSCLLSILETTKTNKNFVDSIEMQMPNFPFHEMPPLLNHDDARLNGANAHCDVVCTVPVPPIKIGAVINESSSLASRVEMFNRAIVTPSSFECMCTPQNQELMAAVVFYNLGLVHHRNGVEWRCSVTLHKALELYNIAEASLSPEALPHINDLVKEHILFAVVSNMCHIHTYFFDRDAAHECRVYLRDKLPLYPYILSKEDYLFVSMNILLSDPNALEAAAAA
jgi:hypothetical protein